MRIWAVAIVLLAHYASGSGELVGFWTSLTSDQQLLFYASATPDSGNFDERYRATDSLGNPFFQGCMGDWTYSNDTLYYKYILEIRRDSATWAQIPITFDSTWKSFPALISGDTSMAWPWSNAVLEKSNSQFTLPNVFSPSAIVGFGGKQLGHKFQMGTVPQVFSGSKPYTISGRRISPLPGFSGSSP